MHIVITGLSHAGFKKIVDSEIPVTLIQKYDEDGILFYDCHIIVNSKTRFSLNNINSRIVRLAIDDYVLYIHADEFLEMRFA